MPNHSLFPLLPIHHGDVRIQRLSQYPKAASRSNIELAPLVLSPVIFTVSRSSVSDHSQLSLKHAEWEFNYVLWHRLGSIKADDDP
ncbi:hypothetical protein CesoFtcFv8_000626 [Champsocephalus esox]|nr:hypothetical protein CesoFtcFv8_000626 [Champsocephalus esox]KAK5934953.1 hypothetical protein CgunFtcFv8_020357 [Champsocephalus gunnari]